MKINWLSLVGLAVSAIVLQLVLENFIMKDAPVAAFICCLVLGLLWPWDLFVKN